MDFLVLKNYPKPLDFHKYMATPNWTYSYLYTFSTYMKQYLSQSHYRKSYCIHPGHDRRQVTQKSKWKKKLMKEVLRDNNAPRDAYILIP